MPKLTRGRAEKDGTGLRRYLNLMSAVLSDGSFGSKTIFVDEVAGTVGGDVLHYGANGRRLYGPVTAKLCVLATSRIGCKPSDVRCISGELCRSS